MSKVWVAAGAIAITLAGVGGWWLSRSDDRTGHMAGAAVHGESAGTIRLPQLSSAAMHGRLAFDEYCASCHGTNAAGTDKGPPLVHPIYEPSHHSDLSFLLAARNGVRAHHWPFGDMPPVEGVTDKQMEWIVTYVRELQRANGID